MCYASCGSNAIRILYRGSGVRVRVISPNVFFCTKIYAFPYTRRRRGGGRRLPQRVAVARTGRTVAERGNGTGRARERARASCVSWKGHTHYTAGICVARVPAGPRAQVGGLDVGDRNTKCVCGRERGGAVRAVRTESLLVRERVLLSPESARASVGCVRASGYGNMLRFSCHDGIGKPESGSWALTRLARTYEHRCTPFDRLLSTPLSPRVRLLLCPCPLSLSVNVRRPRLCVCRRLHASCCACAQRAARCALRAAPALAPAPAPTLALAPARALR